MASFVSTCCGFGGGWLFTKLLEKLFKKADRRGLQNKWRIAQVFTGAGVAIMHGAQDGQKFLSISMGSVSCWLWVAWIPRT